MQDRRFWRSAFLVQTPEGLSRCVSLYAERMDFAPPVQPVPPGPRTIYAPDFAPVQITGAKGQVREFTFDLAEDGQYWLFARAKGPKPFTKTKVSLDGAPFMDAGIRLWPTHEVWNLLCLGKKNKCVGGGSVGGQELKAGRHVIRIRGSGVPFTLTGLAVSDKPAAFEPR